MAIISIPNPSAFAACCAFASASTNELIQISLNKADQSLSISSSNRVSLASVQLDAASFDDDMDFFISVSDVKEIKKIFYKVDFGEILLELTDNDVVMSICGGYLTITIPRYTSANIPKISDLQVQDGKCTALVDSALMSECLSSFAFLAASKKANFTEIQLHSNVVIMTSKSELKKGIFDARIVLAQVV